MLTYRATLDVPIGTVATVSRWIQARRRRVDTRAWQRAATCWTQAVLVLRWLKDDNAVEPADQPSKTPVQRIRSRLDAEVKALHGANAETVITKLNPIIRGWRPTTAPWLLRRSSPTWTTTCGGSPTGGRGGGNRTKASAGPWPGTMPRSIRPEEIRWVFGDRDSGRYLAKFSWTPIARHVMVQGRTIG